jgi:hypothetical protein
LSCQTTSPDQLNDLITEIGDAVLQLIELLAS